MNRKPWEYQERSPPAWPSPDRGTDGDNTGVLTLLHGRNHFLANAGSC